MTDISLKNRIIALVSFALAAIILSLRSALPFTLVFFVFTGIALFFADRIINSEKIKERTAVAFLVFAACYQTFYQCFNRVHANNRQLMTAAAVTVFLAAVFALTDSKKLPYSIFSAPLLCLLDTKVALTYCLLLLSFSVTKLELTIRTDKRTKKNKKNKKTQKDDQKTGEPDTKKVILLSILASAVCLAFCIYSVFKNSIRSTESLDYLFTQFKNVTGFIIFIIYLLIKLIKSDLRVNALATVGVFLNISAAIFFALNYGWTFLSLFSVSATIFLGLICMESENVIAEIQTDYSNHRYLFIIVILCMLR